MPYNLQTRISGYALIDAGEQRHAVQAFLETRGQPRDSLEALVYCAELLAEALPNDKEALGGIDLGDTALQFFGHEAGVITSGAVQTDDSVGQIETFTGGGRGAQQDPVMGYLSEIVRTFNALFSIDMTHIDALMLFVELPAHMADSEKVQKIAADNTEEQMSPGRSTTGRKPVTSCSSLSLKTQDSPLRPYAASGQPPTRPPVRTAPLKGVAAGT